MTIGQDMVVSLHYRLQKDTAAGELVEETFGGDPLVFLFGAGQMIPDFEQNIEGKKAGDWDPFEYPGRRKIIWDGANMKVTNWDMANEWVKGSYRKGWEFS